MTAWVLAIVAAVITVISGAFVNRTKTRQNDQHTFEVSLVVFAVSVTCTVVLIAGQLGISDWSLR